MDAPEKQVAREELYDILQRERDGSLLILSGPRDHEARTAMRHGFALDRMIFVDDNPAVLALHTRNFTKRERTLIRREKAGYVSEVSFRLAENGEQIQVAHLDFCGPIFALTAGAVAIEIPKFISSGILQDGLLAITILSGHEQDGCKDNETRYRRMANLVNQQIETRVPRTAKLAQRGGIPCRGKYFNPRSNNVMLWSIFEIRRK